MSEEKPLSYSEAIVKAGNSITRFPLVPVRGVPLMTYIAENWDSIWAFRPDPSDLLIATYPKAGTQTAVSRCRFATNVSLIMLIDTQACELQAAQLVTSYSTVSCQVQLSYFPFL